MYIGSTYKFDRYFIDIYIYIYVCRDSFRRGQRTVTALNALAVYNMYIPIYVGGNRFLNGSRQLVAYNDRVYIII